MRPGPIRVVPVFIVTVLLSCMAAAQAALSPAELYNKGLNALIGTEVSNSELEGFKYIRQSADAGYAPAQMAMGWHMEYGLYQDLREAFDWYTKAAKQGNSTAQWALGRMYLRGSGVLRDRVQAIEWLQRSADQGNEFGQYLMGVAEDELEPRKALEWYRRAAEKGLAQAQFRLGNAYLRGRGTDVNKREAYIWLLLANQDGNAPLSIDLSHLEAELGGAGMEAAKTDLRERQVRISRKVVANGCTGWKGEFDDIPAVPTLAVQKFCR